MRILESPRAGVGVSAILMPPGGGRGCRYCRPPLHRAELTVQERADHIAEWIRLTEARAAGATCADSLADGRKAGPQHQPRGINAAVRDLGIDRTEA